MKTSEVAQGLLDDLWATAALGDEGTSELARRLSGVLEPALRLRLMGAITEVVAELNHQLPQGRIDARLAGPDIELIYTGEVEPPATQDDALDARITLRLPESLKQRVEGAAGAEGMSVNAWLVRALSRSVQRKLTIGNRFTGFAQG